MRITRIGLLILSIMIVTVMVVAQGRQESEALRVESRITRLETQMVENADDIKQIKYVVDTASLGVAGLLIEAVLRRKGK